jgi:hypothetical protein
LSQTLAALVLDIQGDTRQDVVSLINLKLALTRLKAGKSLAK